MKWCDSRGTQRTSRVNRKMQSRNSARISSVGLRYRTLDQEGSKVESFQGVENRGRNATVVRRRKVTYKLKDSVKLAAQERNSNINGATDTDTETVAKQSRKKKLNYATLT